MAFKSGRGVRRKMAKVAEALVSGWSSPRTRRRRAKMSSFRPLGRLVLAQLEQRGGEDEGGGQGVRVVLAQDAAAAGQGVFVELHLGPAVITSHPALSPRRRVCAKLPPSTSCSE